MPLYQWFWLRLCILGAGLLGHGVHVAAPAQLHIGLIILFGLLYGRFISRFFEEISPYVFIRVGNRQKWVLRKIISLWGISTLFTLFALATELLIAAMKTKDYGMDSGVVTVLLVLLFTLSSLYTSVCLLINMISIQKGVPIGLVLAFCVVLLLELLAIRFYDSLRINV